ncbi:hypothetical protein SprV_0501887800 [Sparganum proliferum]
MVCPAINLTGRLGHHHVPPISPPDENIAQQLPAPRSGVHPGHLLLNRQASLLSAPPADAPYSTLKAGILQLNSVSDRQQYPQLLKEESLGDRKPSELLRRMRSLLGDMQFDDKFVREMILERLPTDVQTILASGSQDLTVSQMAEMADRMTEVQRFQSPSVAQTSTSSSTVNELLMKQVSAMADERATLNYSSHALLLVARAAVVVTARDLELPTVVRKSVSQRIDANVFSGSTGSGRTFYVCDNVTRRRFLMDTEAQISVVLPTAADRRFPSPGLHLQAANCSPIPTFGSLSLTLNIGLRRSFTWIFVIADVSRAILSSDILAEFDLLVNCRRARLLNGTTGLSVRGLTPFPAPTNLSVLDTDSGRPEDIPKTAVTTAFGLFEFIRMSFSFRNASQTFQRFIDHVLRGLPFVYAHIDDLLVASRNEEEPHEHLTLVFNRLDKFGVVINPSKCVLGVPSLEFLGHQVDSEDLRPLQSKVEAIRHFPPPTSKPQSQRFLGMANFTAGFCRTVLTSCCRSPTCFLVPKAPSS